MDKFVWFWNFLMGYGSHLLTILVVFLSVGLF